MKSYFNIFECGRNLLDRLDVTYEQACMTTPKEKYYMTLFETLVNDNNSNGALLSNEKLRKSIGKVMGKLNQNSNVVTKSQRILYFTLLYRRKIYQQSTILHIMIQTIR